MREPVRKTPERSRLFSLFFILFGIRVIMSVPPFFFNCVRQVRTQIIERHEPGEVEIRKVLYVIAAEFAKGHFHDKELRAKFLYLLAQPIGALVERG